jgi:hypothetical protein
MRGGDEMMLSRPIIFCAVLIAASTAGAGVRFPSGNVKNAIETMIPADRRDIASYAYANNTDNNGKISPEGLADVCDAAGWNSSPDDCMRFFDLLAQIQIRTEQEINQLISERARLLLSAGNSCSNSPCAENYIARHFAIIAAANNHLSDGVIKEIDGEIARLVGLLSENARRRIFTDPDKDPFKAAVKYFSNTDAFQREFAYITKIINNGQPAQILVDGGTTFAVAAVIAFCGANQDLCALAAKAIKI